MIDPNLPEPLYRQLQAELRARIVGGDYPIGTAIPPELQLCERHGVSRITVVRAINELVREGFLVRRRGLGTFVLRTAPLAAGAERPRVFAFVIPRIDSDWTQEILAGLEAATSEDVFITVAGANRTPAGEASRIRALMEQRVRGIALFPVVPYENAALLVRLRQVDIPLVFVGPYYPDVPADRVEADNVQAGYLAARHLLELGHCRIAFLGWTRAWHTAQEERLLGYRRAMADAGAEPHSLNLASPECAPLHESELREELLSFLDQRRVSAAVCGNDSLAVTVERYLLSEELRIPTDLALVGISDQRCAALAQVPLTTVRIPARAMGAEAARLLALRAAGDRAGPRRVVVPVSLVVRQSCGAAPPAAPFPVLETILSS